MRKKTINLYCSVNSGAFSILNEQFLFTKNTMTEPCSTKPTTQALHKTTGVARHHIHVGLVCPWRSSPMALAVAAGLRIGDGAKCEPHLGMEPSGNCALQHPNASWASKNIKHRLLSCMLCCWLSHPFDDVDAIHEGTSNRIPQKTRTPDMRNPWPLVQSNGWVGCV